MNITNVTKIDIWVCKNVPREVVISGKDSARWLATLINKDTSLLIRYLSGLRVLKFNSLANSLSWNNQVEVPGLWEHVPFDCCELVHCAVFFPPLSCGSTVRNWRRLVSGPYSSFFCFVYRSAGVRDLQRLTGCMLCCSAVVMYISCSVTLLAECGMGDAFLVRTK